MSLGLILLLSLLPTATGTPGAVFMQYSNAIAQEEWQTSWDLLSKNTRDYLYDAYMLEKSASKKSDEALREWNKRGINELLDYWKEWITGEKNYQKSYQNREIISEKVDGNEAIIKYKDYKHTGTIYMVNEKGGWKVDLAH